MPPQPVRLGSNLVLASGLALFSFVPFEYVAKGTLLVAVLLFIGDPIPPTSRLASLLLLIFVFLLSRLHRQWKQGQPETHVQVVQLETTTTDSSSTTTATTSSLLEDDDKKQA
jgi:predicted membrane metal-binding protein